MGSLSKVNYMKYFLLAAFIFLFYHAAFGQADSAACLNFKKGYFSYQDSLGNTILVHRLKNYQFEKNTSTKLKTQLRITWTGQCSYQITQVSTNSKAARKNNYSTTTVVMDKTDGVNGYAYSCGCKDAPKSLAGFMKKLSSKQYYDLY